MKIDSIEIQMQNGNMIFIFLMNKYQNLVNQYQDEIRIVLSLLNFLKTKFIFITHKSFRRRNNYNREQLHLNDYMTRFQKGHNDNYPQQYYNDYRRRVPHENNSRINNFDVKDYDRFEFVEFF